MLETLVNLWRVKEEDLLYDPDVIVVVSFGVRGDRTLTKGSFFACDKALSVAAQFDTLPLIAYGVFTHSNMLAEQSKKKEFFTKWHTVCVGKVESTIEEAEEIKAVLDGRRMDPEIIVVVTGPCHSRTARWVWRNVFPGADIYIRTTDTDAEIDPHSPMEFNRTLGQWFLINVLRHFAFRLMGFRIARKLRLHQPIAQ